MLDIVVIGDSIAKGVGSSNEETQSFGALVGEKVNGNVTNLGITGLDSSQLIDKLKTEKFQEALEEADVIFVSIGSNDLLKPFLSIVADAAGVSGEGKNLYKNLQKQFSKLSKNDPLAAGNALADAVKNVKKSNELKQACQQFPKNFKTIITELRTNYPEAIIYVNNVYNPYYGVAYTYEGLTLLNIHELCEGYIIELNEAFEPKSKDYTMMDMYSVFRQEGYTNVNPASIEDMSEVNFDPHPNDAGYQLMADYIYTRMDSIAPKIEIVWEEAVKDSENIPVNLEQIILLSNERIRTVAGKELYLTADEEKYTYALTGDEIIEQDNEGQCTLLLSLKSFLGDEKVLSFNKEYQLIMEEDALKDKGNNQPKELVLASFHTEEKPEAELEAHSIAVVNQQSGQKEQGAYTIMWVSLVIFVVIAVAITGTLLYNKKRIKKKRKEQRR